MANQLIRPKDLPAHTTPVSTDVVPSDNGTEVGKVTMAQIVTAGRPLASQAEAEAGTEPTKAMTALTTKQAINALGDVRFASAVQGGKADTAVQPTRTVSAGTGLTGGGDLSADRSVALSSASIASLALADSATQPGDLATVATTGVYNDLTGKPTLGTAAAAALTDFASAAQGGKADSALQSVVAGTNVTVDATDPHNPIISSSGGGGGSVADRTALAALATSANSAYLREVGRQGTFVWNSANLSTKVTSDPLQGVYVAPSSDTTGASGAWVRKVDGPYNVTWFGASPNNADNTSIYNAIITAVPAGAEIVWPKADGWVGSFLSNKPFVLQLGSNIYHETGRPSVGAPSLPVFKFIGSRITLTTLTSNVIYGQTTLKMASTAGLSVGSVIELEDATARTSDGTLVNQEILRVRAVVDSTTVTVWDKCRSYQNSGTKTVYLITPIVGAKIIGGHVAILNPYDPATAGTPALWGHAAESVEIRLGDDCHLIGNTVSNHYGPSITLVECINCSVRRARVPKGGFGGTTTGEYGPSCYIGRDVTMEDVETSFCRNTADFAQVYNGKMLDIVGNNCSNGIGMVHNGFGGNCSFERIKLYGQAGETCGMNTNPQGRTDGADKMILRDITIRDVDISTTVTPDGGVWFTGVYLVQSWANLLIENVTVSCGAAVNSPTGSAVIAVRLDGFPAGPTIIRNIRQSSITPPSDFYGINWCVWIEGGTNGTSPRHFPVIIEDCDAYWCEGIVRARGVKHLVTQNLTAAFLSSGTAVTVVETANGITNVSNITLGLNGIYS